MSKFCSFRLRQIKNSEIDHELIWLSVSIACLIGGIVWINLSIPVPQCIFKSVTGIPCPTCGTTRCIIYILSGEFQKAFKINPLAYIGILFIIIYNCYALITVVFRLPRFRDITLTGHSKFAIRTLIILIFIGNWFYLICCLK